MSLLANESYVNPTTPLWASATNGTIANLSVTETADFQGTLVRIRATDKLYFTSSNGATTGMLEYTDNGTNGFIETNGSIYLGRTLAGNTANTSFTPSAATTNADVLAVGGRISTAPGGGITPLSSSTASTNIPVGVSTSLAPSPAIPISTGLTYDVQINGYFSIPIGTVPAALDKMEILVSLGPGVSPAFYQYSSILNEYPGWTEDPFVAGTTRPFQIRARLPSNANLANIVILATLSGVGVYPAGLDAVLSQVSVVRVA